MGSTHEVKVMPVDAQIEACWAELSSQRAQIELDSMLALSGVTTAARSLTPKIPKRLDKGTHHYAPTEQPTGNQVWMGNPRTPNSTHDLDVLIRPPVQGVSVQTIIGQ